MKLNSVTRQFVRFMLVSFISNLVLYLFYLIFTGAGLGSKFAMSILYILGVIQTFVFNKTWSFSHHGKLRATFLRYISLYLVGYLINFAILILFVDKYGYAHQLVQGATILFLGVFFFIAMKFFIFESRNRV